MTLRRSHIIPSAMSRAEPADAAAAPWVEALFQKADAARQAGSVRLAMEMLRRVAAAAPDDATKLQHLGVTLSMLGRRREAEEVLRRALAIDPADPATHHALATTLMAQGRYREAGPHYAARFALPQLRLRKPADLSAPEWSGEDLAGKRVVVFPEMGFGDQIQHARFTALMRERGAEVWLLCHPDLERLFAESLAGVRVLAARGTVDFPDPDLWMMSGDMMFLPGVAPQTLPAAPYLRTRQPAPPLPGGFKIGLVTAGNPAHGNDANRSLPQALADDLRARLPGRLLSLAPEATGARDFADTAALVAALDLVVTVDSSVAHLAGAMGRRALVLIPGLNTDWRWMHEREDSPWYPSLRLYRAHPVHGWPSAIERLVADARAAAGCA